MAEQPTVDAKTAHTITNTALSQLKAVTARLDADCTISLCVSDLDAARTILQPVFELGESLLSRQSMKLNEAKVYLRETRLCELLLSLLRRWPWAALQRQRAEVPAGLALVPKVLCSLYAFLDLASRVRSSSSQQAAAHAEMSKRCLSLNVCATRGLLEGCPVGSLGTYEASYSFCACPRLFWCAAVCSCGGCTRC